MGEGDAMLVMDAHWGILYSWLLKCKKKLPQLMTPRPSSMPLSITQLWPGWLENQWLAVLILCPVGLAQPANKTLPVEDIAEYWKAWAAILQMLNLSPETNWSCLREIEFDPDYHPLFVGQCIQAACMIWLRPKFLSKEQIAEAVMVKALHCYTPARGHTSAM